jgi:hypothetical protein
MLRLADVVAKAHMSDQNQPASILAPDRRD